MALSASAFEHLVPGRSGPAIIAHGGGNSVDRVRDYVAAGADYLEVDLWIHRGRFEARHERRVRMLPLLFEKWYLRRVPSAHYGLAELLEAAAGSSAGLFLDLKNGGAEAAGAGKGLKGIDPARYGALSHPGDAFSYDIYTQVARSLLQHGPADPLAGLEPTQLIAVGESQSAFALTTYYDGVQPLTKAFDGFFIHSRGGAALPIDAPSGYSDIASSISGQPTKLRTDLDAPVITIETESDVLGVIGFLPARQPDSDHLRILEVAGAAHADSVQLGASESALGCATPINRGQQVFVLRAAYHHLRRWAAGGDPPPKAEPLQVIDGGPSAKSFALDPNGNVLGGVRTPSVDAPTSVLSGLAPAGASVICMLMGSTTPLTADRLANLYTSRKDYEDWYSAATSDAIDRGFILAADRAAVLADAHPDAIAP